jgi:hypothetical protein
MDPWTIGRTLVHSPQWTADRNTGWSSPEHGSPVFLCVGPHAATREARGGDGDLYNG